MQSSGNFRLVVRRGPQPNQVYPLDRNIITLGRDINNNDISINDPEVSRNHCRFVRTPSGYMLEDLGSTNGSFVNGQRLVGSRMLNPGDIVGLGETVILGYEGAAGQYTPYGQPAYQSAPVTEMARIPSAPAGYHGVIPPDHEAEKRPQEFVYYGQQPRRGGGGSGIGVLLGIGAILFMCVVITAVLLLVLIL